MYITKNPTTPVYKPDGAVHGQSPISGLGKQVFTSGAIRNITGRDRGNCYALTDIANGYVRVGDVEIAGGTPPPSTGTSFILLYSFDGDPNPRRFVEVE